MEIVDALEGIGRGEINRIVSLNQNLSKRDPSSLTSTERIYIHEAWGPYQKLLAIRNLTDEEQRGKMTPEFLKKYEIVLKKELPNILKDLKKLKSLEEILKLPNLSEGVLRAGKTNFYDLFLNENKYYEEQLEKGNVESSIFGYQKNAPLNPSASEHLVSTLYGNAISRTPKNGSINSRILLDSKSSKLKLIVENGSNDNLISDKQGMGLKIGTIFVKEYVENLGGSFKTYKLPSLSDVKEVYGVQVEIPLKKVS